jgi:hypothetical protein
MMRASKSLLGIALLLPTLAMGAEPDTSTLKPAAEGTGAKGATQPAGEASAQSPCRKSGVSESDAKAATEAATAYLNALKDGGFSAAPAYLHPEALERFKNLVLPAFDAEGARGARNLLNATFGREASLSAARSADPADFMGRFARVVSARDPNAAPRFGALTAIGVVPEGERLHVLVRLGAGSGADAPERLEVVSLLPYGTGWKVLLDGRLEAIAGSLAGRSARNERRSSLQRMEPVPEGAPLIPREAQGPAGLPAVPAPAPAPR